MTVNNSTTRNDYNGNGVQTDYVGEFKIFTAAEAKVLLTTAGVTTTAVLNSDYTISGEGGDSGFTVTFLSGHIPATGTAIAILPNPEFTQELRYPESDPFPTIAHEEGLDRSMMRDIFLKEKLDRAITLPESSALTGLQLPTPEAGKSLKWNDAEDALENTETSIDELAGDLQDAVDAAAASAAAAATDADDADTDADAAAASAAAAAASAAAAATVAASIPFRDTKFKTVSDSPYTVTQNDNGCLIMFDTSGGACTVNLPTIAGLTLPYNVTIGKATADGNAITVNRGGSDTIGAGGDTSSTIGVLELKQMFSADTDPAPDAWSKATFGASGGNFTVNEFTGDGSDVTFTLTKNPGTENNILVFVGGVMQPHSTFSVSGTTLTFSEAPPLNESIAVWIGTTLDIGVPGDNTVDTDQLVDEGVTKEKVNSDVFANQAAMETATATDEAVTPGNMKYHPLMPKALCFFNGLTTGTNAPTYGVGITSITRNGVGDYTITFATAFANTNFIISAMATTDSGTYADFGGQYVEEYVGARTTTTVRIKTLSTRAGGNLDAGRINFIVWGDQ